MERLNNTLRQRCAKLVSIDPFLLQILGKSLDGYTLSARQPLAGKIGTTVILTLSTLPYTLSLLPNKKKNTVSIYDQGKYTYLIFI